MNKQENSISAVIFDLGGIIFFLKAQKKKKKNSPKIAFKIGVIFDSPFENIRKVN